MLSRKFARSEAKGKARQPSYRPTIEVLEERTLLATDTWTGKGPDSNWSDAANWDHGVPNPGDDLVFAVFPEAGYGDGSPAVNDLAPGMTFHSISFTGANTCLLEQGFCPPGYLPPLLGNAIIVTGGIQNSSYQVHNNVTARVADLELNGITLGADQTFTGDLAY